MSRDIRSFFSSVSNKSKNKEKKEEQQNAQKKRKIIYSDDEDSTTFPEINVKKMKNTDSEKLETVDIRKVFSESPVKHKETMRLKNEIIDDFVDEYSGHENLTRNNLNSDMKNVSYSHKQSGHLTDEERYERKRVAAMLYQKFKNRKGPANPGTKVIPKGEPNCLSGYTFLITGTLDSMDRDEASSVIESHGGKVVKTISKKLNYLICGEDAGPAKLAKSEELGISKLSEDELLDLIREKSNLKTNLSRFDNNITIEEPNKKPQEKSERSIKKKTILEQDISSIVSSDPKSSTAIKTVIDDSTVVEKLSNKTCLSWVDKYKPITLKQIIGQQGPNSNSTKLYNWLNKWHSVHDGNKKLPKSNIWSKNNDGACFKAALLSGPPGVGKTTTAILVCKQMGFDIVEFNASDTRSKKLLNDDVSTLLNNHALSYKINDISKRRVLIMDEVDGMAGNEDRGGIAELIKLIKNTQVPVICLCNDRSHQKIRSLVQHCYDLRFMKPKLEQIRGAMMSICFKEGIRIPTNVIDEIIMSSSNDIRQILNYLAMYSVSNNKMDMDNNYKIEALKKDIKIGPWEVIRKVFSAEEHQHMNFNERSSLFFYDYSLGPLFVHENYLGIIPKAVKKNHLKLISLAANSLSMGDIVEKCIRSSNAWSLLPSQAVFSSVLPGHFLEGNITKQINFPGWLGKNSKSTKRKRIAKEIHDHTRCSTSGSRLSVRLDYAPSLMKSIADPLKQWKLEGVESSLNVIKNYRLLREDLDSLVELTSWPKQKTLFDGVESKVKAALTRLYNKEVKPYSYSLSVIAKKTKNNDTNNMEEENEILSESESDHDDSIENNPFIKVRKAVTMHSSSKAISKQKKIKLG